MDAKLASAHVPCYHSQAQAHTRVRCITLHDQPLSSASSLQRIPHVRDFRGCIPVVVHAGSRAAIGHHRPLFLRLSMSPLRPIRPPYAHVYDVRVLAGACVVLNRCLRWSVPWCVHAYNDIVRAYGQSIRVPSYINTIGAPATVHDRAVTRHCRSPYRRHAHAFVAGGGARQLMNPALLLTLWVLPLLLPHRCQFSARPRDSFCCHHLHRHRHGHRRPHRSGHHHRCHHDPAALAAAAVAGAGPVQRVASSSLPA
jgi:hypothetical protein